MSIEVRRIDGKDLKAFIKLPFKLYKNDRNWVPPLISDMKNTLDPGKNKFLGSGQHAFFMAYENGKPVARILAGYNAIESEKSGEQRGFFSLFEAEDKQSGRAVLEAAHGYLKQIGMQSMKGPYSPTNGEEMRGLLLEGFDSPPALYASYNPEWYAEVFKEFGMVKAQDYLAFKLVPGDLPLDKFRKIVDFAKQRFKFEAHPINMQRFDEELKDIHSIIKDSDARDWGSGIPTWENIVHAADAMKTLADPDLVYIVRRNDGKPLAFVVSIPNYNEALMHMGGRLFPLGVFKFLYHKRKIKGLRIMMQFCIEEYERKATVSAAYLAIMETALNKGYEWGDASTIGEDNRKSWQPVVTAGGKLYKRFRYFEKEI